jgi:hypothetical protein
MDYLKLNIINQTDNGKVFLCDTCNAIHIEYKNLNFNFSSIQFKNFVNYMSRLKGEEWEQKNRDSQYDRKILIPMGHDSFNVMLNNTELEEIKNLLHIKMPERKDFQIMKASTMEFTAFMN